MTPGYTVPAFRRHQTQPSSQSRLTIVINQSTQAILISLLIGFLGFSGYAWCSDSEAQAGDKAAGEARYNKTCINCHGPAGKGVASYPKISGNDVAYTREKLETYRDGIKIGPNSSLMIMMARTLTDEEITNLAAYLKDATYK